ncbi:aminodeoxychorismate synthase component I [Paenarthrobacter sp. DKR-5]|uniref:aminodeoxychorismate synthase component I n=1 Tax=Paenarthrobacter sp. DKR-5 TaxID=2835535 RepID=UPI001BDC5C21|nr:aminodeoxychorismate synthase component I [Paenarthrobacter sp. DKR-5]MBT1001410.1 aminodeoxychorismate synthase component I [Paenarthrobacter sp. DKR-5]
MPAANGGPGRPVIIAVDGRSGSGKTTLAVELAARLREHRSVSVFHLEDIYPGWNGLEAGVERYVSTALAPLSQGLAAEWLAWDWSLSHDGERRTTRPADVVVVEGVGAGARAARELLDAVIWLDAAEDERKHRALDRDGDTFAPHWDEWAWQEAQWLAADDVAAAADVTVSSGADAGNPEQVLRALASLPQLELLLAPERTANRAVSLQVERVDAYPAAEELFRALYGGSEHAAWLDSSDADHPGTPGVRGEDARNRFSILADDGGQFGRRLQHRGGLSELQCGPACARIPLPFFRWLDSAWGQPAFDAPDGYPCEFTLGWLGYLGYELKRETGGADLPTPGADADLIFAGRAAVLDHAERCLYLLVLADASGNLDEDAAGWLQRARTAATGTAAAGVAPEETGPAVPSQPPAFTVRDDAARYQERVREAQEEIADGNSYEICLTTQLRATVPQPLDPWSTYLRLRRGNPAPFAAYLRSGGRTVASTSPERFLRIDGEGLMTAEPIKGTRRRLPDPEADRAAREELRTSAKDRAENTMIVDLLRNDLSHYALPESVSVPRLCAVESYAGVHQLVSTIQATLRPGASRAEAVAAAFPAGSMTGVPKISTMAILDRLEGAPRGAYSGAIGYFSLNGATDLSVVIRTLVMDGTALSLGVGGAVTADSDPAAEWDEVRAKAQGVLSALGAVFPE